MNLSELEYLNVLRKIIVENAKEEYIDIIRRYKAGYISIVDAYQQIVQGQELETVLKEPVMDRTGSGTYKIFGQTMRFNLKEGFPLLTTKKVFVRGVFEELFWFIQGKTNIKPLVEKNVNIWNEWAYERYKKSNSFINKPMTMEEYIQEIKENDSFAQLYGELGPVYGAQWRNFGGHDSFKMDIEKKMESEIFQENFLHFCMAYDLSWKGNKGIDQLAEVIEKIKKNPNDRRLLVFAYNPKEAQDQALPACHAFFQFFIKDGELSCLMYQRSADMFLGVPFNIASYAALTHMVAQVTNLKVNEYIHVLGDAHIYTNHLKQVREQLSREPYLMPTLELDPSVSDIDGFDIEKVRVLNYQSHPAIKGEVSV